MRAVIDAFWRALADSFRPRVLLLTLAPLAVMLLLALGAGYLWGAAALAWAQGWVNGAGWLTWMLGWLGGDAAGQVESVLAPLVLVALVTPLVVLGALLLVAVLMTPAMLRLVARRRFPQLERLGGGAAAWAGSVAHSLGATAVALLALVVSIPFWLVPPLILVLPPLIFGWLTYRVMSYDALAEHATAAERRALMRRHRVPLLVLGIVSGYLGAAPAVVWASGLLFAALFWVLVPVAIWIYTWAFAFSSLWFTHYCLNALQAQRGQVQAATKTEARVAVATPGPPTSPSALPPVNTPASPPESHPDER
ncbi:MAG TPA: EI24 domain-containing protein [Ottowia sp.]|nr:EI24 domain-containing protein [Ottowia sp.]HPR43381.1 EI24 domain-containing protein [Ottowia sp.]